jgi:hypothetical protein
MSHPIGELPCPSKTPHFGDGNGDFHLKRLGAYFDTEDMD